VVVPKAIEEQVLKLAKEKLVKDQERDEKVSGKPEEVIRYLDSMLN
jgi:4-hydroxy-4-methyl-2-oxoglutarate aldolase